MGDSESLPGVLIGFCLSLVAAVVAAKVTSRFDRGIQIELERRKEQLQAYADLMGHRAAITQLYVSTMEAGVFVDFYSRRWLLSGAKSDSSDLEFAKEFLRRRVDLALDLARQKERMFSSLGRARAAFPKDAALAEITQKVIKQNAAEVTGDPSKMSAEDLEAWKSRALANITVFIEQEYGAPLDAVLSHLEKKLPCE